LESLRDALDPENCIEDEFNPKHNKTYVWRGLRLLACERLMGMAEACGEPFDKLMVRLKLVTLPPSEAAVAAGPAVPGPDDGEPEGLSVGTWDC
jgi:hypothetical protein